MEPKNHDCRFRVGTEKGSWEFKSNLDLGSPSDFAHYAISPFFYTLPEKVEGLSPLEGSEKLLRKIWKDSVNFGVFASRACSERLNMQVHRFVPNQSALTIRLVSRQIPRAITFQCIWPTHMPARGKYGTILKKSLRDLDRLDFLTKLLLSTLEELWVHLFNCR